MKVLMVNSNRYRLPIPPMPFGLCCVSAAIEKAGHDVHVLDLCFSKNCSRDIARAIHQFQPDIIGVSVRNIDTGAIHNTLFLLEQVKDEVIDPIKRMFYGPIVIGGPAVGISGAEMLHYFDLEFAIRGDGELATVEFIDRIDKRFPLKGLRGLIWRRGDLIVEDNPPLRVTDLDSLPSAKHYRYLNIDMYRRFKAPIQVQTKRGCALKCSYCTYNIIEGHKVRLRDPQLVADEIEMIVKETGINNIEITDSTFNIPLGHAKSVLRAIAAKKLDVSLQTMGLNPGAIDKELAELLKKVNFKEIQVGMDSGSDSTLRNLKKNFTKKMLLEAARVLHDADLTILWFILVGAPGETEETLKETFETVKQAASRWDLVAIGSGIRLYNGAPLSKRTRRVKPACTNDNFLHPVAFSPKSLNLETLRIIGKKTALKYPNYLFFDDVQRIPFFLVKVQTVLMKIFAPQKPWWKSYILVNTVQKICGINALKRLILKLKARDLLLSTR
jgi:radical SAM superfamily enzyme YgiQ (UPF0313 family)